MGISVQQYRACIGLFNAIKSAGSIIYNINHILILVILLWHSLVQYFFCFFSVFIMLKSWDIETNPGPDKSKKKSLSICHWNLNSMWVENFSKLTQISAFLNVYDFDIFCLSETFLDSSIADDDQRLKIDGYDLHRCDHPSNSRRGGVYVYIIRVTFH